MKKLKRVIVPHVHARIVVYWGLLLLAVNVVMADRGDSCGSIIVTEDVPQREIVLAPEEGLPDFSAMDTLVSPQRPQKSVVAKKGVVKSTAHKKQATMVNINLASKNELDVLPGIGPTLAARIFEYRAQNGSFKSVEELKNVKGIGDKKLAAMKNQLQL